MPHGNMDLDQPWFRQGLPAWWHQAITWTNDDSSAMRSCGIHLTELSEIMHQIPIIQTFFAIDTFRISATPPAFIELRTIQHGFWWWLGVEQRPSHYLNQQWPRSLMHTTPCCPRITTCDHCSIFFLQNHEQMTLKIWVKAKSHCT